MTSATPDPDVGRRLAGARVRRGLSQGMLARRAGIAPSYLSRLENGRIQPTFRTVLRLLRALRADVDELLGPDEVAGPRHGPCPVTTHGRCLLDLIRSEAEAEHGVVGEESYTPRQIRLLRRLAAWMMQAGNDRLRAMEILLDDLMRGAVGGDRSTGGA